MKINLAKFSGFCFGVKRALSVALKTRKTLGKKVYVLGDIVHNEDVVKQIKKVGINKIGELGRGKGRILLIRAHGSSLKIINRAKQLGYNIVDATCPMVKEIHKIAQDMQKKGYKIIIIGDKKHDEVNGIVGQLKGKSLVIDNLNDIPLRTIKVIKKACVVVQSTQDLKKVVEIVNILKLFIHELKFFNTICNPTTLKQEEIKKMTQENDVMIIIGSKSSANTKRLYEISRAINKQSYWVSSKKEIRALWFKNAKSAGVTAGASTPETTTQDIIEYITQL